MSRKSQRLNRIFGGKRGAYESTGAHETAGMRVGPPDDGDRVAIARSLLDAGRQHGAQITRDEADGIASDLVRRASGAMDFLADTATDILDDQAAVALEAVVHTRGRPAVRVLGDDFEDIRVYPQSDLWVRLADRHRATMIGVTDATGAVRVRDTLLPNWSWVQGTAFLIAPDLAITNRHVLFPPFQGTRLARRIHGTTQAKLKSVYDVQLDFAFDNGAARDRRYRVVDVPFVAADADPIDAAVLKVEPIEGDAPAPLTVTSSDVFDIDRLYVVGHPGRLSSIPDNVAAVFGTPDERKRVSFGWIVNDTDADRVHIVHDASTIGGYSGGCVLGFADARVQALHYWGDSVNGNRAIAAAALCGHDVLGPLIRGL